MVALIIIGAILILLVVAIWSLYNKLVKLRNDVREGFSTMDVYMKKRYDLIPNLVATVKGYAKHESETLENVIAARNMAQNSTTMEQKIQNENALSGTLKTLFAVAENYPDLKADKNFLDLQNTLQTIETEISNSRKYYNAVVKELNNVVEMFPSNIIAKMFKFKKEPMFELDNIEERKNVKVEF